jgi:N-acetylmuramoyl-L-alanine amidase
MAKPTYEWVPSPHYTHRPDRAITAIVIHYTGSLSIHGTLAWFQRPESRVSAHYVVGTDGRVVQMVADADIAWHAGRSAMDAHAREPKEVNVNAFSVGIELVGTHDSGFTDRQLASLYALIEILVGRYRILPDRIVGHAHIAPGRKIDPDGYNQQFPWAKTREVARTAYAATTGGLRGKLA